MMRPIDVFYISPPKSGNTWLSRCFKEHPQIVTSHNGTHHYFDVHYAKGRDWLEAQYEPASDEQLLLDSAGTYFVFPPAIERLHRENPKAKIVLCLRHPIERAYSHFLHYRRHYDRHFTFESALHSFVPFRILIETGFYASHIERLLQHFPKEQILFINFDVLKASPDAYLKTVFGFLGVDEDFVPSEVKQKANQSRGSHEIELIWKKRDLQTFYETSPLKPLLWPAAQLYKRYHAYRLKRLKHTREAAVSPSDPRHLAQETISTLNELYLPDIDKLEALTGMDFSSWKTRY